MHIERFTQGDRVDLDCLVLGAWRLRGDSTGGSADVRGGLMCLEQANSSIASVGRHPTVAAGRGLSKTRRPNLFPLCLQAFTVVLTAHSAGWHSACAVDDRADAQTTFNQPRRIEMNLTIKDLSASAELDQAAMTAVRGGDNGSSATNFIGQALNLSVPVAVGANGPANTNVHVSGTQNATILNDQFAGDSYLALFPFAI
jgi:hypothetical protein